jgi:hypothetical protein
MARLKKDKLIEELKKSNQEIDENMTYNELYKLYNNSKDEEYETSEVDLSDEESIENLPPKEKDKKLIIRSIIEFLPSIGGRKRGRGTYDETKKMFELHNAYFHTLDSPNCGPCIDRVYNRLLKIYNENK